MRAAVPICVEPNKQCIVTIPQDCAYQITNIALDSSMENAPNQGKVVLYIKVNDNEEYAIASFIIGKDECGRANNIFQGEKLSFRTKGAPIPVHIMGLLENGFELNIQNGGNLKIIPPENQDEQ